MMIKQIYLVCGVVFGLNFLLQALIHHNFSLKNKYAHCIACIVAMRAYETDVEPIMSS